MKKYMRREGKLIILNTKIDNHRTPEEGFEFMIWKAELYKDLFSFWKSMEEPIEE